MGGHISLEEEKHIVDQVSEMKLKEASGKPKTKNKERYLQSSRGSSTGEPSVSTHDIQNYKLNQIFPIDNWVTYKGIKPKSKSEIPEKVQLTVNQKQLIKTSWEQFYKNGEDVTKLTQVGVKIFLHIFDLNPKIKKIFPYKDMYGKDLAHHETFRGHTTRFMATVAMAVKNIDDMDKKVVPAFINVGKRHQEFKGLDDKSSGNSFFGVFTGSMLYALDEELKSGSSSPQETREAWCRFLDYLIQHIQFGYNSTD